MKVIFQYFHFLNDLGMYRDQDIIRYFYLRVLVSIKF